MVEKLDYYEGNLGKLHSFRDSIKERFSKWKEEHPNGIKDVVKNLLEHQSPECVDPDDYSHIYRRKTRRELTRVSAAVMGIEFSYAAETAFVSPTLLKIGVEHKKMTLVWALSPLVGFFLTPILGSMSDRCRLQLGRRRPFIILMSIGVLIGLLLVPNGEYFGYLMGDVLPTPSSNNSNSTLDLNSTLMEDAPIKRDKGSHFWGIFFTILGTVMLDFDADACQSPARAYLLDVTLPQDHAKGLSTFTIMAGLGGFLGYATGGINWDLTSIGVLLGGHVRAVFTLITIIFIICVSYTITSFREIPLDVLESFSTEHIPTQSLHEQLDETKNIVSRTDISYGTLENQDNIDQEASHDLSRIPDEHLQHRQSLAPPPNASFIVYLKSIIFMPHSLRMVCLTNLFCWMAHVCYSLYFTDFVGEAVFNGDPQGEEESVSRQLYEEGIRFGCWGMSVYSLSCACYSFVIDKLIKRFSARNVYIGGLVVYSTGMMCMALTKHKFGVILFSGTAGVMYSTLFTMPYLLVAHYHAKDTFELTEDGQAKIGTQIRGMGTDVAIVSSMVFLAQFILSMCMGTIVTITGTTTAVVGVASFLAFLGAISATQIMYLDL